MIQCTKGQLSQADWGPWEAGSRSWVTLQTQACLCHVLQNRGGAGLTCLWQVRKTVQQPTEKTLCPWEQEKANHRQQRWPVFTTVKYLPQKESLAWADHPCRKSSHGKYGWLPQLPQWISADVASLWLGISYACYLQLLQWSPDVMTLCRQGHASLCLLLDTLGLPHSLTRDWAHGHSRMAL